MNLDKNLFTRYYSELTLISILFLFFFELIADFVEAVYALCLLTLSLNENVLTVLFLLSPILMMLFKNKADCRILFTILGELIIISRLLESLFVSNTQIKMIFAGFGVGCFLLFIPLMFYQMSNRGKDQESAKTLGLGLLIALIIAVSFTGYKNAFIFYNENEQLSPIAEEQGYFSYLDNVSVKGAVWTSNPVLSAYSDDLFNKIYYPIYDADISKDFFDYLSADKDRVEFVFLDNCGGGIICHPEDEVCEEKNEELMGFLEENFDNVYNKTHGRCWYKIYKNPIF